MLKLTDDLVKDYEKLVYSIISKYSNESNREDLFQAGMMGVLYASKKYDINSNIKFTTFAYKYILGEVLSFLRNDRNIRISRDLIRIYKKIIQLKEKYYKVYGRPIYNSDIAKILNIDETVIDEALKYNEKELSLNMTISDDEKITLSDTIYNKDEIDNNEVISLKDALNELSIDEKRLIYDRYFQNKSQTEISKENNISQVKVYRYERKILDKLKDKMT